MPVNWNVWRKDLWNLIGLYPILELPQQTKCGILSNFLTFAALFRNNSNGSGSLDKEEFLQIPQIANNPLAGRMIAIFDEEYASILQHDLQKLNQFSLVEEVLLISKSS